MLQRLEGTSAAGGPVGSAPHQDMAVPLSDCTLLPPFLPYLLPSYLPAEAGHRRTCRGGGSTHQQLVFCAMHPQLLQPNGQVVDADASVAVNVQDLEQNLEPVLLVFPSASATRLGGLLARWPLGGGWRRVLGLPCPPAGARLCGGAQAQGAAPLHRALAAEMRPCLAARGLQLHGGGGGGSSCRGLGGTAEVPRINKLPTGETSPGPQLRSCSNTRSAPGITPTRRPRAAPSSD